MPAELGYGADGGRASVRIPPHLGDEAQRGHEVDDLAGRLAEKRYETRGGVCEGHGKRPVGSRKGDRYQIARDALDGAVEVCGVGGSAAALPLRLGLLK